jgi:hypothetical protein
LQHRVVRWKAGDASFPTPCSTLRRVEIGGSCVRAPTLRHQRNNKGVAHRGVASRCDTLTDNVKKDINSFRSQVSHLQSGEYRLRTVTSKNQATYLQHREFLDVTVCSRYTPDWRCETCDQKLLTSSLTLYVSVSHLEATPRCATPLLFRWCRNVGARTQLPPISTRRGVEHGVGKLASPAFQRTTRCCKRCSELGAVAL